MNYHKDTYRLAALRSIFLIAGILLLADRVSPTFYECTSYSVFHYSHHNTNGARRSRSYVSLGTHGKAPRSTPDKRYDLDGSWFIVSSNWDLVQGVPVQPEHILPLPEKLSLSQVSAYFLRGPPASFS